MKKHIFGLALFSFIVSAAAIVYAFFNVPEIVQVHEVVPTPQYFSVERTFTATKEKNQKSMRIQVKQAVFDLQTKQFNWELATPDRKWNDCSTFFLERWERNALHHYRTNQ